jgi:hypothetical protein
MKEGLLGGKLRFVTENRPRGGPITMLHAGLDLSRKRLDVCLLSEHRDEKRRPNTSSPRPPKDKPPQEHCTSLPCRRSGRAGSLDCRPVGVERKMSRPCGVEGEHARTATERAVSGSPSQGNAAGWAHGSPEGGSMGSLIRPPVPGPSRSEDPIAAERPPKRPCAHAVST